MKTIRTYTELCKFDNYKDRLNYLLMRGTVGADTFGFERYLNQRFYSSREWKTIRNFVIERDGGCDLALEGYDIHDRVIIHHMNQIVASDIIHSTDILLDTEYLICVSHRTHNAIHYGVEAEEEMIERKPNDTCPWKH